MQQICRDNNSKAWPIYDDVMWKMEYQKKMIKIKIITCHNVYNAGASLQSYALQKYLRDHGHDVEIIDYRPDYLARHYSLTAINNPKFDKPLLRELYILLKLKTRIKALKSKKKENFDKFTELFLKTTNIRYKSCEDLKRKCPEADLYIAGSDQIWNPLFQNGKDPAFFLDFVSNGGKRASYAASFAVESISKEDEERDKQFLKAFDYISVRENSALKILDSLGFAAELVCDPVFLLDSEEWEKMLIPFKADRNYIFMYDFDSNAKILQMIKEYARKHNLEIISAFPIEGGKWISNIGPREFLGVIKGAKLVVSNSFHATAFSIIFQIPFLVFDRKEQINTRMRDLMKHLGVNEKMRITPEYELPPIEYDWNSIEEKKKQFVNESKEFLRKCIKIGECNDK